jgi:hypothetical protein
MKRYLLLSLICTCFAFQTPKNTLETQDIIKTVFELARAGYDNLDAKSLVKAAKF